MQAIATYIKAEVVDIPTHVTGKPCQAANNYDKNSTHIVL